MTEREHDFLKEVILEQLRQLRRCGRAVQLDDEEDYVNDVFVELLSSPDLEEIRNRLVDLISKFANRVTNRNRHSIALPEEEYVQGTQLKTNRRKRVCEIREADMSAHRFNDMLDQHVSHHISVNCNTSTTNSDNLVLNCPESEKKSRNFWTRKFKELSDVTSALTIINPDLAFQMLNSEHYQEGCQVIGDKWGNANCPICGARGCFTITQEHSGWFTCWCYKQKRHHKEPHETKRQNNLPNLFNLFLGGPIRETKSRLIEVLYSHRADLLDG